MACSQACFTKEDCLHQIQLNWILTEFRNFCLRANVQRDEMSEEEMVYESAVCL